MKKFLLAILSVLLFVCLGAAVACAGGSSEGEYYTLVFQKTNGVTYVCEIPSGYEVLEGTTVTFSLQLADDAKDQSPVVYANDRVLQEQDGQYSFEITENTTVRVEGLMAQGSEYNKVIFAYTPGITYNILQPEELRSGMMVKMGTEVSFSITKSDDYSGEAKVYANSEELTAENGTYTFTMDKPVTVSVDGIVKNVDLTYVSEDTRVRYIDEKGEYITADSPIHTFAGEQIKFKVQISVYHVQTSYSVLANSTVLKADGDGYYTYELTDNTRIAVDGLVEQVSFIERADGGSGSINDPFRISRPIDLFQMAMLINAGQNIEGRFYGAYYSLENDIDFEGEQAYIIGDASTSYSFFAGTFNGNGHTISNFMLNDTWIDQESFVPTYITNVGLFGLAYCTANYSPSIYNLNLDNVRVTADSSRYNQDCYVGTLIGVAYGATVNGCTVTNSTIEVTGGTGYGAYVGGLIGQQISAYSTTSNIRYFSSVTSCMTDVDVNVNDGFVYAVGGVTGLLAVGEERLSAYIINCASSGDIGGGINAGGIVGYLAPGTSVANCYSSGAVIANSPYGTGSGYSEEIYYAYAGGIVGRAGFNTSVYNCFSTGHIDAIAAAQSETTGVRFEVTDPIAAHIEDGNDLQDAHAYPATIFGSVRKEDAITEDFIRNTMHWDAEDWIISNGAPVFNPNSSSKQFAITYAAKDGVSVPDQLQIDSEYFSMSRWFMQGKIQEYVEDGANRSYGYFFDSDLENRIPMSFVPTGDMTIYIGYANYSEVAGTYYLGESADVGARLVFGEDGIVTYINGALSQDSTYTYDGEQIVILNSYLGELSGVFEDMQPRYREYYLGSLYNFGATVKNGIITLTGGFVQEISIKTAPGFDIYENPIEEEVVSYTGNSFRLFPAESPLTGLKAIENFKYIDYYGNGNIYTFNGNGTGVRKTGDNSSNFTYAVSDAGLTLDYGDNNTVTATVENGYVKTIDDVEVKPYDGFTGAWERPFAYNVSYTFDGKSAAGEGTWTKSGVGGTASGTYTVDDSGVLHDKSGAFTAVINENGMLDITETGKSAVTFYVGGSFVGEWYYSQRTGDYTSSAVTINLRLNGINNSGLGSAVAEYTATGETVNLTYQAVETEDEYTLHIYNQSVNFASLNFNQQTKILEGTLNGAPARLTSYDGIKGLWISNDETVKEVQFNGRGFYDLSGDPALGALAVTASVYVNGSSAGKYTLDYNTMKGLFTYKGVQYSIEYDMEAGNIKVTANGSSFTLQTRDIWYARKLVDQNGFVYSFDGRGELTAGGNVTAINGNGEGRKYTYHIQADGSIALTAQETLYKGGTITLGEKDGKQVYLFTEDGKQPITLTYSTPFTGNWIIGGVMGELTIGNIYADFTADGSYKFYGDEAATSVTFKYNEQGNYLEFPFKDDKYYVNALTSATATELSVGPENSLNGSDNSVCIDVSKADDLRGKEYKIYDSESKKDSGEKLVFDGLSASVFGSGTAVRYDASGEVETGYSYTVDIHGNVNITYIYSRFVMVEWEKDSEVDYDVLYYLHSGDTYYAVVYPDGLYGVTIKDVDEAGVTYEFNGAGGVVRHSAEGDSHYVYFILLSDNITYRHIIRFVGEDDTVYSVTLNQVGNSVENWTIKMTKADAYFEVNALDSSSESATFLFDGAGRVIRLTTGADESPANYTYVLVSDDGNTATFTFTNSATGEKYTAVLDKSGSQEEWTVTLTAQK